tara:strand:+ start:51 stop:680 length:630 start_codon:yes stop_codon:yes gene_type:complete
MTLPAAGNAISINSLVGEYGGSAPHSLSEYYRGGGLVANHSNNANVPTSGTISLSNFHGQSNTSPAPTSYSYSMTVGTSSGAGTSRGFFASNPSGGGSLSPNPQTGTAFASGFNPTIFQWAATPITGKTGGITYTWFFIVTGHIANSGWTSFTLPSGLSNDGGTITLTRSSGTYNQNSPGGNNRTQWEWSAQARGFSVNNVSGTMTIAA